MPPSVLAELLALLSPPACVACRAPLRRGDEVLCAGCGRALPWIRGPRCPRCALPGHPGARCPAARAAFEGAWAPLAFDGPARAVVVALKHRGALPLADLMAAHVVATAPPGLLGPGAVLVPVPSHPVRRRRRGFDHAARLAAAVAGRRGLEVSACLRRRGPAVAQVGASRAERRAPGRLAVEVLAPPPVRVVLVDDVHTTGATLDAAARALRGAGAGHVAAVTYARTL
jgi:predicted amidophosphoribosyltransferase